MNHYLEFLEQPSIGRKTRIWSCVSKTQHTELGVIKWFAQWRQYVFYPAPDTLFNTGCLGDIEKFIKQEMHNYKYANGLPGKRVNA